MRNVRIKMSWRMWLAALVLASGVRGAEPFDGVANDAVLPPIVSLASMESAGASPCDACSGNGCASCASRKQRKASCSSCDCGSPCGCACPVGAGGAGLAYERMWVRSDALLWWLNGNPTPPLVTTSNVADEGILFEPSTQVLYGGDQGVGDSIRLGVRVTVGYWLDDDYALEGHGLYLANDDSSDFSITSVLGTPVVGRPFYDTLQGQESAFRVGFPNLVDGTTQVRTDSELSSAGLVLRQVLREGPGGRIDILGGYRYLRLKESTNIYEDLVWRQAGGFLQQLSTIDIHDSFSAENQWHGGEIGVNGIFRRGRMTYDVLGKIGFGAVQRHALIYGRTAITPPASMTTSANSGLNALASNSGSFRTSDFSILPELNVNTRYQATDHLSFGAGFSLLYVTKVLRSGSLIDRRINTDQVPFLGGAAPPVPSPAVPVALTNNVSTLYALGLNFTTEFVW